MNPSIHIGEKPLSIDDFEKLIWDNASVELNPQALGLVSESFAFLKDFSQGKIIYGINTGFGPMAQYRIEPEEQIQLQYNLIRSHSSGLGAPIDELSVRAILLARLNTLCLGRSGVSVQTAELLARFLREGIVPIIPEHGSVGASGDLVQLAHLALGLIGEGELLYKGNKYNAKELLQSLGIEPLRIVCREGLALMNGTSCMNGIGMVNALLVRRLLDWSIAASVLLNELVESYEDHLSPPLNDSKLHPGQRRIAHMMYKALGDGQCIRRRSEELYNGGVQALGKHLEKRVQEYYSLRCVPQILGPVFDTLQYCIAVLENEVNSANDNPIVDAQAGMVYHGGNFHGDYVALEMDKLKIVVTKLSLLAERQLNFLVNPALNGILPPFVNRGVKGLNFGVQGTQFTATSTAAENQMLANPMYVHSIPNNNDNQDVVSMGTNAALICRRVIENAFQVVAIEWLTLVQAVQTLDIENRLCSQSRRLFARLAAIAPPFVEDQPFYLRNAALVEYLKTNAV